MINKIRWFLMVLFGITGVFAGINRRQQQLDCNDGGNNATYYEKQFKKGVNPFGTTFDGFCITEDLTVAICCIDDSVGAVIDGFEIYEIDTVSPEPPKWALRMSDKSANERAVNLSSTCLSFNRNLVMEGEKFGRAGKVHLMVRFPDNSVRNLSYISDLDDTPYSVWVPPPPMEISRSKDYVHVALAEDYPFAFRDWQLCVCMEDDSHSECMIETETWELSLPIKENAGNEVEICVGFAYAKSVGTFGPNRTCQSFDLDIAYPQSDSTDTQSLKEFFTANGIWILFTFCGVMIVGCCFYHILWCRIDLLLTYVKKRLFHNKGLPQQQQQPNQAYQGWLADEKGSDYHIYASIDYQALNSPIDSGYSSSLHGNTSSSNYISGHRMDPKFDFATNAFTAKNEGIMYQSAGETNEGRFSSQAMNLYSASISEGESQYNHPRNSVTPSIAIALSDYVASSSEVDDPVVLELERETDSPVDAQSDQSEDESVDDLYKS